MESETHVLGYYKTNVPREPPGPVLFSYEDAH